METNTKILLAILIVITLPITIPLVIISLGIIITAFMFVLGMLFMYPIEVIISVVLMVIGYGLYKWYMTGQN